MDYMRNLIKKVLQEEYSSRYMFFQNITGYNFVSLSELLTQQEILDIKFQKGIYNISVPESVYSSDKFRFMKISESERIPIISPRQYKKFEMKKNRKSQKTNLFKSY